MIPVIHLQNTLGYQFNNEALLITALTHRSSGEKNNERLEFLGDSVLNFTITIELFRRFEVADEGTLTRMRAHLVCREMLAEIAKELTIGDYLVLGSGELRTGGHQRQSILADALEAIIGGIFLDGGPEVIKQSILRWYQDRFDIQTDLLKITKDPKSTLQELLQSRGLGLPEYEIMKIEGEQHKQYFHVVCRCELLPKAICGEGASRRKAEQAAASEALRLITNVK